MLSLNINSYFSAIVARHSEAADKSLMRLSSGHRISSAADDAAGLAIAEVYRSQSEGASVAARNIQTGINLMNVAMDGVQSTLPVLQRIRELVLQGANANYTDNDRAIIQTEVDTIRALFAQAYLVAKDSRIALDGVDNADRVLHFQVGPQAGNVVSVDFNPLRSLMLMGTAPDAPTPDAGIFGLFGYEELREDVQFRGIIAALYPAGAAPLATDPIPPGILPFPPGTTWGAAFPKRAVISEDPAVVNESLRMLDKMLDGMIEQAAYLGAVTNRLEANLETVMNFEGNILAAESQIRDVDMAAETTRLTKAQVLQQSSQEMLKQMNARPFKVLELLQAN